MDVDTQEGSGFKVAQQEYNAYLELWNPLAHRISKGINGGFEEANPTSPEVGSCLSGDAHSTGWDVPNRRSGTMSRLWMPGPVPELLSGDEAD